jgi:aryl-phospho-beta-D-glucosidase BglC (GH1 family)
MKRQHRLGVAALLALGAAQCGECDNGRPTGSSGGYSGSTGSEASVASSDGSSGSTSGERSRGASRGAAWSGLRVSGTTFVDGTGKEIILRGLGIGEWLNAESYILKVNSPDVGGMGETKWRSALVAALGQTGADQFFTAWEANLIAQSDVALWASWGVNSIRLPVNYHAISSADGTYVEAGFQILDTFIAWCKAQNIYVILDLHAAPGAQNCEHMSDSPDGVAHLWKEPEKYRQWTIDLWQTIAKRYAGEVAVGGYDIFDEPYDTESSAQFSTGQRTLRQMYVDITTAIRAVDPNHVLFFEGTNWSSDDGKTHGFAGLEPAWDPQMAWSFHKYWDANTTSAIQPYLDLRANTNRPVWNGETGEDRTTGWSKAMIALLEANKIGWNEWTFKKVGTGQNTNPYSIPEPANWSAMATYLANFAKSGSGTAPSPAPATPPPGAMATMMALADNARTAKCLYNAAWVKEIFNK